jgi:hypothetical protein
LSDDKIVSLGEQGHVFYDHFRLLVQRFLKENHVPDDIPRRPECAYKKRGTWKSWREFLGTSRSSEVEVLNDSTVIFAIVNSLDEPRNVFSVISSPFGEQDLVFKIKNAGYTLVQLFKVKETRQDLFKRYIEGLQTTYFGGSEKLLMSNPNEELYRLELLAEQLNRRSVGD